jgi:AraC-like DNA-binding protein
MMLKSQFPAVAAGALLRGFAALDLDVDRIRAGCELDGDLDDPARLLPDRVWHQLWDTAREQRARPELAFEVGLAMPFGAFGMFDFLIWSSATCGAALTSLVRHFRLVAFGFELSLEGSAHSPRLVIVDRGGATWDDDELTLGVTIARLRGLTTPTVRATAVSLRRRAVAAAPYETLGGARTTVGVERASVTFGAPGLDAKMMTADPALQRTMLSLVSHLGLGEGVSEIEAAVRSRLRLTLADGVEDAASAAESLGLSVRTLHRRVAEAGTTFADILDAFRAEEAERLLRAGLDVTSVGARLGYRETSSFTRAFRRWRGVAPSRWLATDGSRGNTRPPVREDR